MVADHKKDIAAHQKETEEQEPETVAAFASETLRKHLETAQSLQKGPKTAKQ